MYINLKERETWPRGLESQYQLCPSTSSHGCAFVLHLLEVDFMSALEQVKATLPHTFKEKNPKTYVIVDVSEVFIDFSNDLQLQSSKWSNYKHHNTVNFLVCCTPNDAISFVSPLYLGSIFDACRVNSYLWTYRAAQGNA